MRNATPLLLLAALLLVGSCHGEEASSTVAAVEKEEDSKATESKVVKIKAEPEKEKRAPIGAVATIPGHPPQAKVMIMPPVSLMIAMPHPSGRFLMLFPTTQLLPLVPMPYVHQQVPQASGHVHQAHHPNQLDHPAMFAARHQMLYGSQNYQSQHQGRDHYFSPSQPVVATTNFHQGPTYSGQGNSYLTKRNPTDGA